MNTTAAPVIASAKLKGRVTIGGNFGSTEVLVTLEVPRIVWEQIDAPEEWVGHLSATKRVHVGNITTSYWMTTYDRDGNDMEIGVSA